MSAAQKHYYRCSECRNKTSTTDPARAGAKACVRCRPDLDAWTAKAKVKNARDAAPRVRGGKVAAVEAAVPAVALPPASAKAAAGKTKTDAMPVIAVPGKTRKVSGLDAAAMVLRDAGAAMSPKEILAAILRGKLWASPKGKTPEMTLAAAMGREIAAGGDDCRFIKPGRGKFAANPGAA